MITEVRMGTEREGAAWIAEYQCRRHGMGKPGTEVPDRWSSTTRVPKGRNPLPKSVVRIKCYPRFSDHRLKLCLIGPLLVVLRLMLDVINDGVLVRTAYAESSVSLLPFELKPVLVQPARRIGFQNLNRFGRGHIYRQRNQQMRMVGSASGGEYWNTVVPRQCLRNICRA